MGKADGDADFLVGELVDVGEGFAVAAGFGAGVDRAEAVPFVEGVGRDGAPALAERPHRLHVDRAGEALAEEGGVGGLVDHDAGEQLGGVLVVFHGTAGAGADLFAAVQQTGAEVAVHPADDDGLGATVLTLRGDAGQARQGFGDTDVGQLADVLGGDHFGDQGLFFLDGGGGGEAAGETAGHLEFFQEDDLFGGGRRGFRAGGGRGGDGLGAPELGGREGEQTERHGPEEAGAADGVERTGLHGVLGCFFD